MSTLHLTRGIPGSGKTTFARQWVAENPAMRVRVNRDDVRAMIHTEHAGRDTETLTTRVCHTTVRQLLRNGRDVICDDTNLNARFVKGLLKLAEQCGAAVEFHDFHVAVDEAVRRDLNRGMHGDAHVGPDVINRFARYLGKDGALPPVPELPAARDVVPYVAQPGTPLAIIVDLDGTIAHNHGHRSFYDYSNVYGDTVHWPIVALVQLLQFTAHQLIFVSGRDDSCREDTESWLREVAGLDAEGSLLLMRASGDTRDDSVVKLELFDEHIRDHFDVRYVLDDRNRVVQAWRSVGLTVLQVADGDF